MASVIRITNFEPTKVDVPEAVFLPLARFIIGDVKNAPKTRGTYGVRCLFERCGIAPSEFDGRPKEEWARAILRSLSMQELLRVLERLVSPVENGSDAGARSALGTLNSELFTHRIQLVSNGEHLAFAELDVSLEAGISGWAVTNGLVSPDFEQLDISDNEAQGLSIGWNEAVRCYGAGAYLAATVMLGSLLEALLLLALKRHRETIGQAGIQFMDNKNQSRPIEKWSLNEMIEAASRLGWTTKRITSFAHSLREYRNYVHPELRRRPDELPRSHECLIGSAIVSGAVQDLRPVINSSDHDRSAKLQA